MATYSTLGKCLLASIMVGGGVTGVVLGTTGSGSRNEVQVVGQATSLDSHSNHSTSLEEQDSGSSTGLSAGEENSRSESNEKEVKLPVAQEKLQLEQSSNQEEGKTQQSEKESPAPLLNKEVKLADHEQRSLIKDSESQSYLLAQKNDLDVHLPKQPLEKLEQEEQADLEAELEDSTVVEEEEEDFSHKNWFLVNWSVSDHDLDGSEWMFSECKSDIKDGEAVISCSWNFDDSKIVELHLSLASDTELNGKRWEDLKELTFSSKVGKLATLDLTFKGDPADKATTIFIYRRKRN